MLNAINSASSALRAYAVTMNVSAHNVANINTEGYSSQRASLSEARGGGVKVDSVHNPAEPRQDAYVSGINNVHYAKEAVEQIVSLRAFQANAASVRSADEMLGTLINMLA
jgi:flagellar basal-body rod protein FlgC